ncbi:MAG: hydratase [Firmicutes bacterium]|nr:hydratase [Bacillota bacterium]
MVELIKNGVYLGRGKIIQEEAGDSTLERLNSQLSDAGLAPLTLDQIKLDQARAGTIAFRILTAHNQTGDWRNLKIKFDALASHDITYVGIVQTARASGLTEFPVPYVLTNCHNSLCAVGGTINEDDHVFGLSAAQKYGGIFVPAHQGVIHQYMREMLSGCGKMILGSDSHTRYGALGTMGVGEGGPELVKQLLKRTYDLAYPEIIAVYLEGKPSPGVGPQDVALALIKAVFSNGFVKNKILEFVGPGVGNLSVDFRNGIDVMTTETTCLSSIWLTDESVREYYRIHGRLSDYQQLETEEIAYYDGLVKIDLCKVEPMIALPFHPSNAYTIKELNRNPVEILQQVEAEARKQLDNPKLNFDLRSKIVNGRLKVDQGVVAGCAGGTFENICDVAEILSNKSIGQGEFNLSVYPASQPVNIQLANNGVLARLLATGATFRTAFCGPCFGAGDVPANNALSIRHTTRNFPNREGSKPSDGQLASVALMDARSIAATALNGGVLTAATEINPTVSTEKYVFNATIYQNRVFQGFGKANPDQDLKFGPNIADWPSMIPLPNNILLKVASFITDSVTTTDELIPSGETSSYRSNPFKLAEFTLSRKDPGYVERAKAIQSVEEERRSLLRGSKTINVMGTKVEPVLMTLIQSGLETGDLAKLAEDTGLGSLVFAVRPGDGSAREQAASCQKVLGGWANIAVEYATKRYRSNLINWGMLPLIISELAAANFKVDDYIYLPGIRQAVAGGAETVKAYVIGPEGHKELNLALPNLSSDERDIILAGCLINYYAKCLLR